MMEVKTITTPIEQPNCFDEDGYLNIHPIIDIAKQLDCPFIAFIGEKRIGKTYGCIKYALQEYYSRGVPMFYARRYDKTFTESICGNLVNKHRQEIINLSKGKHNACRLVGKYYDLMREQETQSGLITRRNKAHFAFCRSLNNIETETADDKGEISCVVYDEFLTRGNEIKDEFNKLMVLHANATAKRVDQFTPMFLLGNTVSRESETAECFGIRLRDLKRGLNIITNTKGVPRIIVFYVPETVHGARSAETYYDRFENDHINMIAHGDWTIGTYRTASQYDLSLSGTTFLISHNNVAVCLTVAVDGMQPRVIISKPCKEYDIRITSGISKTAINYLPPNIVKLITGGYMVCETPVIGEDFRDICKHIHNAKPIVDYIG